MVFWRPPMMRTCGTQHLRSIHTTHKTCAISTKTEKLCLFSSWYYFALAYFTYWWHKEQELFGMLAVLLLFWCWYEQTDLIPSVNAAVDVAFAAEVANYIFISLYKSGESQQQMRKRNNAVHRKMTASSNSCSG